MDAVDAKKLLQTMALEATAYRELQSFIELLDEQNPHPSDFTVELLDKAYEIKDRLRRELPNG